MAEVVVLVVHLGIAVVLALTIQDAADAAVVVAAQVVEVAVKEIGVNGFIINDNFTIKSVIQFK